MQYSLRVKSMQLNFAIEYCAITFEADNNFVIQIALIIRTPLKQSIKAIKLTDG